VIYMMEIPKVIQLVDPKMKEMFLKNMKQPRS